jgi:hypothetical protein
MCVGSGATLLKPEAPASGGDGAARGTARFYRSVDYDDP